MAQPLINPITISKPDNTPKETNSSRSTKKEKKSELSTEGKMGLNLAFFTQEDNKSLQLSPIPDNIIDQGPKKRSTRKSTRTMSDGSQMVPADDDPNAKGVGADYYAAYDETSNLLKGSIMQIDALSNELKQDVDQVRASKVLKNKYTYITEITGTQSSLIATKISAIREINSSITNAHRLELQRQKELKMNPEGNDDKSIIDLYNAFVNTPIGTYQPLGPNPSEVITAFPGAPGIIPVDIDQDPGYLAFQQNATPEQNRMAMENNPNIEEVVVYNQDTGVKYFDVIDRTTGQSIPANILPRPSDILLGNMTINIRAGTARNADVDRNFRLICVGGDGSELGDY